MGQLGEGRLDVDAHHTFEGFLACVLANVQLQHAGVSEGLPTHLVRGGREKKINYQILSNINGVFGDRYLASVWTFTRMNAMVYDELRFLRKCCTATAACMGFHIVVGAHVLRQVALERSAADVAEECLDILMNAHQVLSQGVRTCE